MIKEYGTQVWAVLADILNGKLDGLTFEGGKLLGCLETVLSNMKVIKDFKFLDMLAKPCPGFEAIVVLGAVLDCPSSSWPLLTIPTR